MIPIAREGLREILLSTLICGVATVGVLFIYWPLCIPFIVIWLWVLSFFRDPQRKRKYIDGELCSPADGTITEITELDHHDDIGGPAIKIGMFLSLFNVHANRMACSGKIRSICYQPGEFLDARHPESGQRNESNTLLIDPDEPLPGPIVIRQVSGLVARRIICHAKTNEHWAIGSRFGMIKFGSRTELIIPKLDQTEVAVSIGDKVHAGLTILARQPVEPAEENAHEVIVAFEHNNELAGGVNVENS